MVYDSHLAKLDFPYRAMTYQALDEMTAHVEPDPMLRSAVEQKEIANILEVLKFATDHGMLSDVVKLATSPKLKNKNELGARLHKMTSTHDNGTLPSYADLFREFQAVVRYLEQNPDADVIWDSDYVHTDGKKYQGDLIALHPAETVRSR